jgi:hypothetical protein
MQRKLHICSYFSSGYRAKSLYKDEKKCFGNVGKFKYLGTVVKNKKLYSR